MQHETINKHEIALAADGLIGMINEMADAIAVQFATTKMDTSEVFDIVRDALHNRLSLFGFNPTNCANIARLAMHRMCAKIGKQFYTDAQLLEITKKAFTKS